MGKENFKKIVERVVNESILDVIFVKPEEMLPFTSQPIQPFKREAPITPEERLIELKRSFKIRVQSVALPKQHQLFAIKSEEQVLDWLQNNIHSEHTANYKERLKYGVNQKIKFKPKIQYKRRDIYNLKRLL